MCKSVWAVLEVACVTVTEVFLDHSYRLMFIENRPGNRYLSMDRRRSKNHVPTENQSNSKHALKLRELVDALHMLLLAW